MRRATPGLALALLTPLLAGCLEPQDPGGTEAPLPQIVRDLAKGQSSGIHERTREVLEDEAAWRALWARHVSGREPAPPAPSVDFATERVVAVVEGDKPSGCHDVQVLPATADRGTLDFGVILWNNESAETGCTGALTQPFHFVAVRDRESRVQLTELERGPRERLLVRSLDRGSFSGVHEPTRALLRTEAEWTALWARHRPSVSPPRVEFPNESVVAVVERGPTGCFGVHVGNVTHDEAERRVVVEVVHERTPEGVACVAALMDVYHFVAVPAREGEASFVETEEDAGAGSPASGSYAFRTLARGSSSGLHEPLRLVVRDDAAWRALWANHTSNQAPPSSPPEVDFSKEWVLAALAGDRSNACWSLRVERVDAREDAVEAHVATYAPPPGAMCGQMVTQPFHFVTYPRTEAPLRVVESERDGPPPDV